VIPLFVTGALLGASTGHVLGGDPALFAMVGAVTMVSAALNTPVAGVFLGIELFGGPGVVLLAVACVTGYVSTGQTGIYSSQPVAAHKSGRRD
jgi:H+/Cl- antiporter ClcA